MKLQCLRTIGLLTIGLLCCGMSYTFGQEAPGAKGGDDPAPQPPHRLDAVQITHDFLSRYVARGARVLDATAGNGHDTLFLALLVGIQFLVAFLHFDVGHVPTEPLSNSLGKLPQP